MFRNAQALGVDYLNLGFAGNALMEEEMANYLVSRRDWDFASVEMGINTTEREACERKHDFEDIECGLTQEGACAEAGRCLRCDHFGYGIFRGGRNEKW
mgnify:FL=1